MIYKGFLLLGKDEVTGSNPVISSMRLAEMQVFCVIYGKICMMNPCRRHFGDLAGVLRVFATYFAAFREEKGD